MNHLFLGLFAASLLSTASLHAQGAVPADLREGAGDSGLELLEFKVGGVDASVESSVKVNLSGWMRVDYGFGNRFGAASGKDQLGISKMALETDAHWENFDFVAVLGASILSDQPVDTTFKDLFVVWHEVGGTDTTLRLGAGPILFGLKPAGYPGDRSIVPSIEFGGAGGFAVSNQAGPSVRVQVPVGDLALFEGGVFDTNATTAGTPGVEVDGSRVSRNYFGQFQLTNLGIAGLHGVIGYEGLYVGGADDSVEPIYDIGLAYGTEKFDASLEYIVLDQNITATADDESYWVAELTALPNGTWSAIADYSVADELDASTVRLGTSCNVNDHVTASLEYAHDTLGGATDVDSGNLRLAFHF